MTSSRSRHSYPGAVDAWLTEYQDEFGPFTEEELRKLADATGATYLPPIERPAPGVA